MVPQAKTFLRDSPDRFRPSYSTAAIPQTLTPTGDRPHKSSYFIWGQTPFSITFSSSLTRHYSTSFSYFALFAYALFLESLWPYAAYAKPATCRAFTRQPLKQLSLFPISISTNPLLPNIFPLPICTHRLITHSSSMGTDPIEICAAVAFCELHA